MGHGRNPTVIRADISEFYATVEISAVVQDLLEISGTSSAEWDSMDDKEMNLTLRKNAGLMADRFGVIRDQEEILVADSRDIDIPDEEASDTWKANSGQHSVQIRLNYRYSDAPARLTFLQRFGANNRELLHHVQLMIRQKGELVMLPAALGNHSPISFSFDWQTDPEEIADLVHLDSVMCGLENRPVSSALIIEAGSIEFSVSVPIGIISPEDLELSEEKLLSHLKGIRRSFTMMVDETKKRKEELSTDYFTGNRPGSAHSHAMERRAGFVMSLKFDASPGSVSVITDKENAHIFPVYGTIIENSGRAQFTVLQAANPQFTWNHLN